MSIRPEDVAETLQELGPYFLQITDAQLKDYGESANAGVWVSFRLPEPESLEPYRGQDRSGRNARTGKRYKLMVIAINDDEVPMEAEEQQPKPRKLSQIAGGLCHDPLFRAWVADTYGEPCADSDQAADFIRSMCGIDSRAKLDTDEAAATTFRATLADWDVAKRAAAGA